MGPPGVPRRVEDAHASRSPTAAGVILTRGEETFYITSCRDDGAQRDIPYVVVKGSIVLLDLWHDGYDECHVSVPSADLESWVDFSVSGLLRGGPRDAAKLLIDILLVCRSSGHGILLVRCSP